jgi:hypothetical protein
MPALPAAIETSPMPLSAPVESSSFVRPKAAAPAAARVRWTSCGYHDLPATLGAVVATR